MDSILYEWNRQIEEAEKETEMKSNDVFPSKWLKAEDLDGELTVTISRVVKETFKGDGKEEIKPCAYFSEVTKGLIINKTNWKLLVEATGQEDSDNWIGKKVTLGIVDVDAFGDVVSAIRVKKAEVADKNTLIAAYNKLLERAKNDKIEGLDQWALIPNMTDQEIMSLGKELKAKVLEAEAF